MSKTFRAKMILVTLWTWTEPSAKNRDFKGQHTQPQQGQEKDHHLVEEIKLFGMTQAVCEWVFDRHVRLYQSVTAVIGILSLQAAKTDL